MALRILLSILLVALAIWSTLATPAVELQEDSDNHADGFYGNATYIHVQGYSGGTERQP